jgi:hypothetical protein
MCGLYRLSVHTLFKLDKLFLGVKSAGFHKMHVSVNLSRRALPAVTVDLPQVDFSITSLSKKENGLAKVYAL